MPPPPEAPDGWLIVVDLAGGRDAFERLAIFRACSKSGTSSTPRRRGAQMIARHVGASASTADLKPLITKRSDGRCIVGAFFLGERRRCGSVIPLETDESAAVSGAVVGAVAVGSACRIGGPVNPTSRSVGCYRRRRVINRARRVRA